MQAQAPPAQPADPGVTCPNCGSAAVRDQPFCLDCGRRLALDYRRPPNWRIPIALIALVVIAAGTAAGIGITRLTAGDEGPDTITVTTGTSDAPAPQATAPSPPAQEPAQPSGAAAEWPSGREAYTVVLLTTKNEDTAAATARRAAAAGLPAGVLESDDFARFEPGLFVVFSGQYDDVDTATAEAKDATSVNPGAYARFVEPR